MSRKIENTRKLFGNKYSSLFQFIKLYLLSISFYLFNLYFLFFLNSFIHTVNFIYKKFYFVYKDEEIKRLKMELSAHGFSSENSNISNIPLDSPEPSSQQASIDPSQAQSQAQSLNGKSALLSNGSGASGASASPARGRGWFVQKGFAKIQQGLKFVTGTSSANETSATAESALAAMDQVLHYFEAL